MSSVTFTSVTGNIKEPDLVSETNKDSANYTSVVYDTPIKTKVSEFEVEIENKSKGDFTPLGISNPHKKDSPMSFLTIEFKIKKQAAKTFTIEIFKEDEESKQKTTLYSVTDYHDGTNSIENSSFPNPNNKNNSFKPGTYILHWDGFDNSGVLDTSLLQGKLKVKITAISVDATYARDEDDFEMKYKKVEWVDIKVYKQHNTIDVTLRTNLKDGGAKGLNDGNKIPQSVIKQSPITSRTRSFSDLKQLTFEGLRYYWGRNKSHPEGNDISIDGKKYEVYIFPENATEKSMDDISLVFNTNKTWIRSSNPARVKDPISFFGNSVPERIGYNVGYLYDYRKSKEWTYDNFSIADEEFKETAAHEIGHEILQAVGGTIYSYKHKGSSYLLPQNPKKGTHYPLSGEIDLMEYFYEMPPQSEFSRIIAAENDVIGLLWLTIMKVK